MYSARRPRYVTLVITSVTYRSTRDNAISAYEYSCHRRRGPATITYSVAQAPELIVASGAIEFQYGCQTSVFKYNCNVLEFLRMPTEIGVGADFQ
jgi:hypothetical protein